MKSYLLSSLAVRLASGTAEGFRTAQSGDWLVWEPGAWRPPGKATLIAVPGVSDPAKTGEALVLALEPKKDSPGQVTLGRGDECAITINDGTLSTVHLSFMKGPDAGWTVRDAGSKNGSTLDGAKLDPGQPRPVRSGAKLQAGQVNFTFYDVDGLMARLKAG